MVYVVVTRYIPPVSADGGMQGWKRQPNFNDARGFGALAVSFMNSPSSPTPPGHRLQPRVTQDFEFLYQAVFYGQGTEVSLQATFTPSHSNTRGRASSNRLESTC